jgi:hypothetical protein
MELTLGGLLGAIAGAILGGLNYVMLIGYVEGWLKSAEGTDGERSDFESNVSLMRRAILGFDVAVWMGVGYWLGTSYLSPALGAD